MQHRTDTRPIRYNTGMKSNNSSRIANNLIITCPFKSRLGGYYGRPSNQTEQSR